MQYDLRSLLIILTVAPAAIASLYWFACHVAGMEDWKFVVSAIGLIVGFYCLRNTLTTTDASNN